MQRDKDNNPKVIAYYSRRLNTHEENYSVSEQELLAVVNSIEHFHVYLDGTKFKVFSDHSALQWLFNIKNPQSRLYRWSVRLSTYNFEVIHRKDKTHQHVDSLSRAPIVLHIT